MRLIKDMSSILWKCLLVGKDTENGYEIPNPVEGRKPLWINSAEWGYENFVNNAVASWKKFDCAPRDTVMVFDGEHSKLMRQQIYPDYKKGKSHPDDSYIQFDLLLTRAKQTLLELGALGCKQDGIEADDVIAHLCKHLQGPKVVETNDGDMLVLHGPDVDVYRDDDLNVNKYGYFDHKYITLFKALCGDSSDGFKGAVGFADGSFLKLYVAFGDEGLDSMIELIETRQLGELAEDVGELKVLQKIIDSAESVYASYDCAMLYPEKVNTGRKKLTVEAGMVVQWDKTKHDARLKPYYGQRYLIHADKFDGAMAWAMGHLLDSPFVATDIETSTPDESDEWLDARKRSTGGEDGSRTGVDVLASKLTGQSFAFGKNMQYSVYMPVDHVEQPGVRNLKSEQVRQFCELVPDSKAFVVQNASFELSVLWQAWRDAWKDNGWHGFLPNMEDTAILKSYVDENTSRGLKSMSRDLLGYEQQTYDDVTRHVDEDGVVTQRKMNQLTAAETLGYGVDDSVCTAALYTYLRFIMELEHTWDVYKAVEIGTAYLNAHRFVVGTHFSMEKMLELEDADQKVNRASWAVLRDYLIANGWSGTVCPTFQKKEYLTPAAIKQIYAIVTGRQMKSMVRTPAKLAALIRAGWSGKDEDGNEDVHEGQPELAAQLENAGTTGEFGALNDFVAIHFSGEPDINMDSPVQMRRLLYETLALPVRLTNRPTDKMRKDGLNEGTPKTDNLAMEYALAYDQDKGSDAMKLLKSMQLMKMTATRQKMYYTPYRAMCHWRDGLLHPEINQCQARTRRGSGSNPNLQFLPKHPKMGQAARFRETYIPHKKSAVVASMDFDGQELRLMADRSQDANMLACYIGENQKKMHVITALGILQKKDPSSMWRMIGNDPIVIGPDDAVAVAFREAAARWKSYGYDDVKRGADDPLHPDHKLLKILYALGKKTNFTTEYGAQAPKLAETLIVPREEAQEYIDAKHAAFARAEAWKREVITASHKRGYGMSAMGARRHLPDLYSSNKYDVLSAERQTVNFEIQGSCAEQTKIAEGRMWDAGIFFKYDAQYIGPIHDELVSSCAVEDLIPFLREKHALMVQPYADMKVPVVSSISFGRNFGEQIEVGTTIDEVKIRKALQSLGFADSMTNA